MFWKITWYNETDKLKLIWLFKIKDEVEKYFSERGSKGERTTEQEQ